MPAGISFVLALLLLAEIGISETSFSKDCCRLDCNVAHFGINWLQKEKERLLQEKSKLLAEEANTKKELETMEDPMIIGMISNEIWRNKLKLVSNNKLMFVKKKIDLIDYNIKKIKETQETINKENY